MITAVLTFAAALSVGWWVALPCLLGVPPLVIGLRWYLARAKDGYLRETASYSQINATLTETVEGARTVEALGLGRRADRGDRPRHQGVLRRRALHAVPAHRVLPEHGDRLPAPDREHAAVRRLPLHAGQVSLGDVTAATLYVQMLIDPVDRIVSILDELQMGAASMARLLGVAQVPDDREVTGPEPRRREDRRRRRAVRVRRGPRRAARRRPVRRRRRADRDGRPLRAPASPRSAGCSPASTRRAPARSPSAASAWSSCRWATCAATSRWSPRSTTSSSARCARTSRLPPLREPPTRTSGAALDAVDAQEWVRRATAGSRHRGRLGRPGAAGRAGPADRAGPPGAGRPAHAGARRGHLADRPARGPAPRALAGRGPRGPHGHRDRAPAVLGPRRRPGRRGRGRRDLRVRLARRAGGRRRLLRRARGTQLERLR